uniref:Uncharacterized protein n=1 Tax=Solanum tuberosum TaxID=4113 RepID=M1BMA7_SOLTU
MNGNSESEEERVRVFVVVDSVEMVLRQGWYSGCELAGKRKYSEETSPFFI